MRFFRTCKNACHCYSCPAWTPGFSHAVLKKHQRIKVKMRFIWIFKQHHLGRGRFLTTYRLRNVLTLLDSMQSPKDGLLSTNTQQNMYLTRSSFWQYNAIVVYTSCNSILAPSPYISNQQIIVQGQQKKLSCSTFRPSRPLTSSPLISAKLHYCLVSSLTHALEMYFQIQFAEVQSFNKPFIIKSTNRG